MVDEPHDGLTRHVLSDARRMEVLLKRLPEPPLPWVGQLGKLVRLSSAFVDSSLERRQADLVFAGQPTTDGTPGVCVLFEHQSTPNSDMPLRALEYATHIMREFRQTYGPRADLPRLHIVVLYHGDRPWNGPLSLNIDKDGAPSSHLTCRIDLIDLARISDEEIEERLGPGLLALVALVLKHGRRPEMGSKIPSWDRHFAAALDENGGIDGIQACVCYLLEVSDVGLGDIEALPFARRSWEVQIMLKTTGQKLREEGRIEGREQGLKEGIERGVEQGIERGIAMGIEKGRVEERSEMLRLILRRRFGDIPKALETRIQGASPETLKRLIEAALDADDLSELLEV